MNLSNLFSTRQRVKILEKVIYQTGHLSVNVLARELKISKGLVSKYFSILVKEDILKERKNRLFISDNYKVKAIRLLFNLSRFPPNIFNRFKFIKAAGLYGSYVKGENTEESDIDLWIKIEAAKEEELAKLSRKLNTKFRNLRVLFLTDEKIEKIKKDDPPFYHSLSFGSITVYGEENAL